MPIIAHPATVLGTQLQMGRHNVHWNYAHNCLASVQYNATGRYICLHSRPTDEVGTWDVASRVLITSGSDWQFAPYLGPYSGFVWTSTTNDVSNQTLVSYDISSGSPVQRAIDPLAGAARPNCAYSICEARNGSGHAWLLVWPLSGTSLNLYDAEASGTLPVLTSINPAGVGSPGAIVCDLPPNASGHARWLVRTNSVAATITYIVLTYNGSTLSESAAFALTSANQNTYYGGPVLDATGGTGGANQSNPSVFVDHERGYVIIRRGSTTAGYSRVSCLSIATWLPVWSTHVPLTDSSLEGIGWVTGSQTNDQVILSTVLVGSCALYPVGGTDFSGPGVYDQEVAMLSAQFGTIIDQQSWDGNDSSPPYYGTEVMIYDGTTGNVSAMASTNSAITSYDCQPFTLEGVVVDYVNEADVTIPNIHWYIRRGVAERAQILQKGPLVTVVNDNALLIQEFLSELVDANPSSDYQKIETDIDLNGHSLLNLNEDILDGLRYS